MTPGLQKTYETPRSLQTSASKPKKFYVCVAADNKGRCHLKRLTTYNNAGCSAERLQLPDEDASKQNA